MYAQCIYKFRFCHPDRSFYAGENEAEGCVFYAAPLHATLAYAAQVGNARRYRTLYWAAALLSLLLMVSGCGVTPGPGSSSANPQQPPVQAPPAQPPPGPVQSGSVLISPQYAALAPGKTLQYRATVNGGGAVAWLVNGVQGGSAATGTIDANGNYTAPATLPQSANVTVTAALAASPTANFATAVASIINPGVVTPTANPQVALYSIYLPAPGNVHIEFGPTISYGLPTWQQPTPSTNGGEVQIFAAGMQAQTLYHMRARVALGDGADFTDSDQTFTAGTPPLTATVAAAAENGQTPQPGIELFDTLIPYEPAGAFATDLSGNVIWTYSYQGGSKQDAVQPLKLLPDGHFLVQISYSSSIAVKQGIKVAPGTLDEIREVDLAGDTIRSLTQAQLAASLTAKGYNLTLGSLHHDVLPLPNGHIVLLATVSKQVGANDVLGDVLIDVDQNFQPDWVWNAFDHLEVNRHPYLFPDWTHSNSLLYSKDDHDLLLSMRHQNWIIKIDFADGQGSGRVLWRLGEGGDFKLVGGNDPADWFYSQHGIAYFSPNTSGVFRLGVMDNGDDRPPSSGAACPVGPAAASAACYSTVPVLQVDETAMTATLVYHYKPAGMYSFFGGDVAQLANGDLEADFCAVQGKSVVQELNTQGGSPRLVWQAVTAGTNQYRAERMPSLYPGVQW